MFLLDTNIVSESFKKANLAMQRRFEGVPSSDLFVSSIVEAELRYGVAKKRLEESRVGGLVNSFLNKVTILPWISSTAICFARLRTDSESSGISIATVDLMIAAHAKEHRLTLVTHDTNLLRLKPWLRVVDWVTEQKE